MSKYLLFGKYFKKEWEIGFSVWSFYLNYLFIEFTRKCAVL